MEAIYKACRDVVSGLRQRVAQQIELENADRYFWLALVATPKEPLYEKVIELAEEAGGEQLPENLFLFNLNYYQPFHLSTAKRQQIY